MIKESFSQIMTPQTLKQALTSVKLNAKNNHLFKSPTSQNHNKVLFNMISQKRRQKAKCRPMFTNDSEKEILQSSCLKLSGNHILLKSPIEDLEESNECLHQMMTNQQYLSKKKCGNHKQVNQEVAKMFNHKGEWILEQIKKEQIDESALNKFTNIVIKKLQNKGRKVSFSQFLQNKRHQDYLAKFKYKSNEQIIKDKFIGKKNQTDSLFQREVGSNRFQHSKHAYDSLNRQVKSVILTETKKHLAKIRAHSKTHERYHSITGQKDGLHIIKSLEISKIKGHQ